MSPASSPFWACSSGTCFAIAAVQKPFAPGRVGLWRGPADQLSLHLGLASGPPPAGEELLGWWIVPVGLLVGAGGVWLTTRFGRWCIGQYRRTRPIAAR